VSSSPLEPTAANQIEADRAFLESHRRIGDLIDQGNSFSGSERNCLFMNTRDGRFATVSAVTGIDFPDDARSPGLVDWDHDGDLDLWVSNRTAPMLRFLRNDSQTKNHWIALKLTGKDCNRDAIGARVTIRLKGGGLVMRTLKAGEGFLAQSSKWLHFGLGDAAAIETISVQWPGGRPQILKGPATNARYELLQGGEPVLAQKRSPATAFDSCADPLILPDGNEEKHRLLGIRVPLPPLRIEGIDLTTKGKPLLINLWASWCADCTTELSEFKKAAAAFQKADLGILPLSMDKLGSTPGTNDAGAFLKSLGIPFQGTDAQAEVVDQLRAAASLMAGRQIELPVPTSFLLDRNGALAAVYLGPVKPEQILQDVQLLKLEGDALHDASLPFRGRWFSRPRGLDLIAVPRDLMYAGQLADAATFVERAGRLLEEHKDYAELMLWIGDELMKAGKVSSALLTYERILTVQENHLGAMNNLAWHLAAHPDKSVRDGKRAVSWAEKAAIATDYKHPALLDTLAAAYAQSGEFGKAVKTLELAEKLAAGDAALLKGIRENLTLYRAGRTQP
jgi:peroxiredoxin